MNNMSIFKWHRDSYYLSFNSNIHNCMIIIIEFAQAYFPYDTTNTSILFRSKVKINGMVHIIQQITLTQEYHTWRSIYITCKISIIDCYY